MRPLAIVPARSGSKGVPLKNFRTLAPNGDSATQLAIKCADAAGCDVVVSSDHEHLYGVRWLMRPAELSGDAVPIIDVVRHVLQQMPDHDTILVIQPTQPLREPKHIARALELLTPHVDSVVSVVELPRTHNPKAQCVLNGNGTIRPYWNRWDTYTCRQELGRTFIRDGTVYAFRRKTVTKFGTIYGAVCQPMIVPPEETCPLDTESDWREAERRLRERG